MKMPFKSIKKVIGTERCDPKFFMQHFLIHVRRIENLKFLPLAK